MAKMTLRQTLIDKEWVSDFQADHLVNLFKDWIPSEAPPNPLNSSSFDYGFQLGYNAYREEILRSLQ